MDDRDEILVELGQRVRTLRDAQGLTRRELAERSGLSQRFLADLEGGVGNISIGRLFDVATALGEPLLRLLAAPASPVAGPRLPRIEQLLQGRSDAELDEVQRWLEVRFGRRSRTVALLGLRGAGKSSVGSALARALKVPFVELDERVEQAAGMSLGELFELHGSATYQQLQREVLGTLLTDKNEKRACVIATGGSIVSDAESFRRLRQECVTVWLKARPEDHWNRVIQQGDHRPMRANPQAMAELRALYAAREPLYAEADVVIETSQLGVKQSVVRLVEELQGRWSAS